MNPIASLDDSVRARIGHDIGDFADRIWTNAALPRVTGLGGSEEPEPVKPSRRSARHPISQDNREAGGSNKAPASNQ